MFLVGEKKEEEKMRLRKRIPCLVLCICMIFLGFSPMSVKAETQVPFEGDGTESSPWLIADKEDLVNLASFINSGQAADIDADAAGGGSGVAGNFYGYYFKQTADIDLKGVNWEPIGYSGSGLYFAGNYDGGNHLITNVSCSGKNDDDGFATGGIFGWVVFGSVSNLHVKNAEISATGQNNYSYAGGITGVVYGSAITNCSVSASYIESKRNLSNNNCAGSISGYSTGGTFSKCAAEHNKIQTMGYGGGFVGEVDDDYGVGNSTFTDCYVADAEVTAYSAYVNDLNIVGGFAGGDDLYQSDSGKLLCLSF